MKDEMFFDTSILVYAYDRLEPRKRKICKPLIEEVFLGQRTGVISNQVLAELYVVLTAKKHVPAELAEAIVKGFIESESWRRLNYTEQTVSRATSLSRKMSMPFWDALIAGTMIEGDTTSIATENDRDFAKIPGLRVWNPLR